MLLHRMPVDVAYTCVSQRQESLPIASHFTRTYIQFLPSTPHRVAALCNGGPPLASLSNLFGNVGFEPFIRSNVGWDIGGYIEYSRKSAATLLVCLGESVYLFRDGWLERMIEARRIYGPGIYGFFSSYLVRPHLNTTAFAVDPRFLWNQATPRDRKERYEFEHGTNPIWKRVMAQGGVAKLVTWDGAYDPEDWRKPANILWRGDQSNCLLRCHHLDKYDSRPAGTREKWSRSADGLTPFPEGALAFHR